MFVRFDTTHILARTVLMTFST